MTACPSPRGDTDLDHLHTIIAEHLVGRDLVLTAEVGPSGDKEVIVRILHEEAAPGLRAVYASQLHSINIVVRLLEEPLRRLPESVVLRHGGGSGGQCVFGFE